MRHHLPLLIVGLLYPAVASAGGGRTGKPVDAATLDRARAYAAAYALSRYHAIPSFSRQTGLACSVCHTAFPMLTAFGRQFKLNAYTLTGMQMISGGAESNPNLKLNLIPPVSTMLQTSVTDLAKAIPGTQNGNIEFPQELSVFFGEAISPRMGTFIQITYDAAEGSLGIDNVDLRYAKRIKMGSTPVLFGFTVNNSPTVQDVWNSTPVWRFPFGSSGIAPTPAAAPLIEEALAQTVAGFGSYALWDEHLYGELSGYRSAPPGGAHPPDAPSGRTIKGVTPYRRFAYQPGFNQDYLEIGTYGLSSRLFPSGVTGPVDRITDIRADLQLQHPTGRGFPRTFVLPAKYKHETPQLAATIARGGPANPQN